MTGKTEREPIGVEAEDLLAAIVGANVRSLAFTTDALLDNIQQQRDDAWSAFAGLYDALAAIPDYARSVVVERLLCRYDYARSHVMQLDEERKQ